MGPLISDDSFVALLACAAFGEISHRLLFRVSCISCADCLSVFWMSALVHDCRCVYAENDLLFVMHRVSCDLGESAPHFPFFHMWRAIFDIASGCIRESNAASQ